MTETTDRAPEGSAVTDSEPTPATRTVGVGQWEGWSTESTRPRARGRARIPSLPRPPELLRALFVGDETCSPYPFRDTLPRLAQRLDYALHGDWCSEDNIPLRVVYVILTALIACPVAIAVDLFDWLTFPLGRLFAAIALTLLITYVA